MFLMLSKLFISVMNYISIKNVIKKNCGKNSKFIAIFCEEEKQILISKLYPSEISTTF